MWSKLSVHWESAGKVYSKHHLGMRRIEVSLKILWGGLKIYEGDAFYSIFFRICTGNQASH